MTTSYAQGAIALTRLHGAEEQVLDRSATTDDNERVHQGPYVPPADRGRDAWLFLTGCFVVELLLWGFPFSYGVFQDYFVEYDTFPGEEGKLAVVGTVSSGIMYIGGPLVFILVRKKPWLVRYCTYAGLVVIVIGLMAASFVNAFWQLVLTQGLVYGVGGTMIYAPCIVFLGEWFVERKGLAFGVMWAGTGCGGVAIPFITQAALEAYGFRTVLRGTAVIFAVTLGPLTYYLKPRLPLEHRMGSTGISFSFMLTAGFWVYQVPNIVQGLGYFIPGIYLPTYANALGLPSYAGPLTLALFNGAAIPGTILVGMQTDRFKPTTTIMFTTVGSTLSVFLLWGLSASLPTLCVFSICYGFFAGAFSTTWSAIIREIQANDGRADSNIVFGMLAAGRGIGNIASGPLSEALLSAGEWKGAASLGYGTSYGSLIVFVGITAAFGGFSWIGKRVGSLRVV